MSTGKAVYRRGQRKNPTGTDTITRRYAQRLRGAWNSVSAEVTRGVKKRDVFGLEEVAGGVAITGTVAGATAGIGIAAFINWLRKQFRGTVLEVISPTTNPFIRSAYERGVKDADVMLSDGGVSSKIEDLPEPAETSGDGLRALFRDAYQDLLEIVAETVERVRRTLETVETPTPDALARMIREDIEKEGIHRSNLLADSTTIEAHAEGVLDEAERKLGPTAEVRIRAEWLTAGDSDVCPICEAIADERYTIREMRTGTFTYQAGPNEADSLTGTYSLHPPAHPHCRCALVLVLEAVVQAANGR